MKTDLFVFIGIPLLVGLYIWLSKRSPQNKEYKEYERKLKESLKDEFIIDPETGIKLTLEEAENGKWLAHDNEFRTIPDEEINKITNVNEKQIQIALNYLRESRFFTKTDLTDLEVDKLIDTKILSGYDDWSYDDCYKFENGLIFSPSVEWNRGEFYQESHLMIWLKIQNIDGHYAFREKFASEKFFDTIRSDDEIKLKNYECFTIKKSFNIIKINSILSKIIPTKDLEIEIDNNNLFIKTRKLVSIEDIKAMELLINKFR